MLSIYPACFFKEENGYSVIFPDLDDLATCGENLEEAMTMAVDCLAGHLYTLKQEGKKHPPLPPSPPSRLNKLLNRLALTMCPMPLSIWSALTFPPMPNPISSVPSKRH